MNRLRNLKAGPHADQIDPDNAEFELRIEDWHAACKPVPLFMLLKVSRRHGQPYKREARPDRA